MEGVGWGVWYMAVAFKWLTDALKLVLLLLALLLLALLLGIGNGSWGCVA